MSPPPIVIQDVRFIIPLLISFKLLLIPSYKSTDFDVHRNWLAITHHLPLEEWYFDDRNGTTVHTLDYPPSFAFFEYLLSNNFITKFLIQSGAVLDSRCLALLGDVDNEVGYECIFFHRCTVIFGDVFYLVGAWLLYCSLFSAKGVIRYQRSIDVFVLTICNPGLILLDHIHFQYNGMLLGILMTSLAFLIRGLRPLTESYSGVHTATVNDILGAILFATLLTFKHLYLTLAPFYAVYLLRKFCFIQDHRFLYGASAKRLIFLTIVVLITLVLPFVPFMISGKKEIKIILVQILSRLFPFQRGLCHDYWAGNLWALYLGFEKVMGFVVRLTNKYCSRGESCTTTLMKTIETLDTFFLPFPKVTPTLCAVFLFIGLIPGMICAWKVASTNSKRSSTAQRQGAALLYCVVYSSISTFMLSYHVHEKAIMTCIIPMTFLAVMSRETTRLYLRLCVFGHFGLLPLLFQSTELLLKIFLNVAFLSGAVYLLEDNIKPSYLTEEPITHDEKLKLQGSLVTKWDKIGLLVMVVLLFFVEVIHPICFGQQMEFLPLMLNSTFCAFGLIICWLECGWLMLRYIKTL